MESINQRQYNYNNVEQLKEFIGQRVSICERQDNHGSRRSGFVARNNYICENVKIRYDVRYCDNAEYVAATFVLRKDENAKRRVFVTWFFDK